MRTSSGAATDNTKQNNQEKEKNAPPKAVWSGILSLGLVNVPVKAVSLIEDKKVHFRLIHRTCETPISYKKVCERGDEVQNQEIIYGYEIARNEYVLLDRKDISAIKPKSSEIIKLDSFVSIFEVDPHYFERTYLLIPDKSDAAYALLREAMTASNRAAIGKMTLHTKEHIVLVHVYRNAIVATTLRYDDEVSDPQNILDLSELPQPRDEELEIAREIVEKLTSPLNLEKYQDEYRYRMEQLIQSKIDGKILQVKMEEKPVTARNLMDALKKTAESIR